MRSAILIAIAATLATCVGAEQQLPANLCTPCGTACVDVQTDSSNCGGCGKVCPGGQLCKAGACVPTCQSAMLVCGGACVDPLSNASYCGAKGNCATEDAQNSKGKACPAGEFCAAGLCAAICGTSQVSCGGNCIDPASDPVHCGAKGDCTTEDADNSAGLPCPAGQACVAGACTVVCAAAETVCAGGCVNTASDPQNCGVCGKACVQGEVCSQGACGPACLAGTVTCDPWTGPVWDGGTPAARSSDGGTSLPPRACVDLQIDDRNCGACGKACDGSRSCVAGACTYATSCADLQRKKGHVVDGEYLLDPDGSGPVKPFSVYCSGLSTPTPKAYLTFAHSLATSEPNSNYLMFPAACGDQGCSALTTRFSRAPIDLSTLTLESGDATFAFFDDPTVDQCWLGMTGNCHDVAVTPAYGVAYGCSNATLGAANLDLRDTPFTIDPSVTWTVSGFEASGNVTINADRDVVDATGGGFCGANSPTPSLKLKQR